MLLFTFSFGTDECAYFINQIGFYKNKTNHLIIKNKGLTSTEDLITEYQYKVKRERLKRNLIEYLDNLVSSELEKYRDISVICTPLKRLSNIQASKDNFNIKNTFFKNILIEFHQYYYEYKNESKSVYIKGCESYANIVSQFIFKYHKSNDNRLKQRIQKSINKYNECKYFEYKNLLNKGRLR